MNLSRRTVLQGATSAALIGATGARAVGAGGTRGSVRAASTPARGPLPVVVLVLPLAVLADCATGGRGGTV